MNNAFFLPSRPENILWGHAPCANTPPVLTVPSGSVVVLDTISHEGVVEDQGRDPCAYFAQYGIGPEEVLQDAVDLAASDRAHDFDKNGPHILTGPVALAGAAPGDVLKVEVLALEPRVLYGVVSSRQGKGALPGEYPRGKVRSPRACPARPDEYGNTSVFMPIRPAPGGWEGRMESRAGVVAFPAVPFLGTMGVATGTTEELSSVPPRRVGGNIDINELGVGATLYLPVEAAGALFYAGDPHFAQGDGEVALSALEGSLRAALRPTVLPRRGHEIPVLDGMAMNAPFAETETHWLVAGLHEDLDEAMRSAVRNALAFVIGQFGIEHERAYAYLSAAVDFEVSQVVDRVKGIHGRIAKADFAGLIKPKIAAPGGECAVEWRDRSLYVRAEELCGLVGVRWREDESGFTVESPRGLVRLRLESNWYEIDGMRRQYPLSPVSGENGVSLPVAVFRDIFGFALTWSTVGESVVGRMDRFAFR